jgi:D-alanyl-lipoteichoic acid acyltransferase DltB (MBOAT superfamily)
VLFYSIPFAIFFVTIFFLYWSLPHKYRWFLLLLASYYFYISWGHKLVAWLFITTVISYICARAIEINDNTKTKKCYMMASVIGCLSVLFVFKYFNFFSTSICDILQRIFSLPIGEFTLTLILPIGISFYIFKTVSYVIEVYRGTIKAEKHFGIYALYVSFFPQIIAGPIERAQNLIASSASLATVPCTARILSNVVVNSKRCSEPTCSKLGGKSVPLATVPCTTRLLSNTSEWDNMSLYAVRVAHILTVKCCRVSNAGVK